MFKKVAARSATAPRTVFALFNTSFGMQTVSFAIKNAKLKQVQMLPNLDSAAWGFLFAGLCRATLLEIEFYAR